MTGKPADKITEALHQLLEGYYELQQAVREDLGAEPLEGAAEDAEPADTDLEEEVDVAVATELRTAVESMLENEEYSVEELAALVSSVTEAIEEIDPDVFASEDDQMTEDFEDYEDEDEDDDYDYDEDEELEDIEGEDEDEEEDDEKTDRPSKPKRR